MPLVSVHDLAAADPGAGPARHLVLPFAASESTYWWPTVQGLPAAATRHLQALLKGMQVVGRDSGDVRTLTPPHERVLARELGWGELADGLVPWAAAQRTMLAGSPAEGAWGLVTLCHWAMGREHATLSDPEALDLGEEESRALMQAMQPFFESDGIRLHYLSPLRWLAEGEPMALPTASLDRVVGRNVDPWLPSAQDARVLRRLQNEMQMLLYTHPVNEARQQRRQLAVNSIWFSGTGRLPASPKAAGVNLPRTLAQPALAEDWPGYAQAWGELDTAAVLPLLEQQQAGQTVRLSLCGERGSVTLQTSPSGLMSRLKTIMGKPAWPGLLQGL